MGSNNNDNCNNHEDHEDVDEIPLPGFRFHPTDDELVGFYLCRKVEKKPISIELIKAIDIYKYEPWDLPKATSNSGDKEWYFFCKRGRKYKNSIRPNRVTGSGFWKATGIDKPIHSHGGQGHRCIGLKKTLVYYRGSAGKGTKTDWMMHEFRLPSNLDANTNRSNAKADLQEAEIWTLCRIFKRNMSYRKYTPDWRELSAKRIQPMDELITSKKSNIDKDDHYSSTNINNGESYIDFSAAAPIIYHEEKKPLILNHHHHPHINVGNGTFNNSINQLHVGQVLSSSMAAATQYNHHPSSMNSLSSFSSYQDIENELFIHADWDELRSVVDQFVVGPTLL